METIVFAVVSVVGFIWFLLTNANKQARAWKKKILEEKLRYDRNN